MIASHIAPEERGRPREEARALESLESRLFGHGEAAELVSAGVVSATLEIAHAEASRWILDRGTPSRRDCASEPTLGVQRT